jgi:hypothetical protein
MPVRLGRSCTTLPRISSPAANANPKATLPAAGTVTTEMKTPERPPTFTEVKDR